MGDEEALKTLTNEELCDVAKAYRDGDGIEKELGKAVRLFRIAAERGDMEAQYQLGKCYAEGEGIMKDKKEAFRWFLKAADRG